MSSVEIQRPGDQPIVIRLKMGGQQPMLLLEAKCVHCG
jgi:hypothetical protein